MATRKEIMLAEMTLAERDGHGFEIKVKAPDMPKAEGIRNPKENIPYKRAYYEKAYDDNLQLIANPEISITSFRAISGNATWNLQGRI